MKQYENTMNMTLDPNLPYIVRIDGHHFSQFLRSFKKPNDERVHRAMLNTTHDLVFHFKANTGYTQSDEITLIFTVRMTKNNTPESLPNKGRVIKMATLFAGYASTSFFKNLLAEIKGNENLIDYVMRATPHFDARVFNVPENYELVNNVKWRHNFDCRRNSISSLASRYLPFKVLKNLNSEQKIKKLKDEKGIDWEEQPHWYKFGCFIKLERYDCYIHQRNKETKELDRKLVKKFRPVTKLIVLDKKYNTNDESFLLSLYVDSEEQPIELNSQGENNEGENNEGEDNEGEDNQNNQEVDGLNETNTNENDNQEGERIINETNTKE